MDTGTHDPNLNFSGLFVGQNCGAHHNDKTFDFA